MPDQDFQALSPARLDWQGETPSAPAFADSYFSVEDGPAETRHVFLDGNRLAERFVALPEHAHFVIGETGFGTGLNFLSAAQLFLTLAPASARLHVISAEKHPLAGTDLARAQAGWTTFATLATELQACYPVAASGFHDRHLARGRIRLTLMFGAALAMFRQSRAKVDAWFLDGFAPSRNPDMWHPPLFDCLSGLSRPGATLATFTAAGFVRRGLTSAGFAMRKTPGFGRKRDMLTGQRAGDWVPRRHSPGECVVIGAGLAGACTAQALAERGHRVRVIDAEGVAAGASGNLAGVVYTSASAHPTPQNRFYQASYLYALYRLNRLGFPATADDGALSGVIQYPATTRHTDKAQAALTAGLWPEVALQAAEGPAGSLLFPDGGYLRPARWCAKLLDQANIELIQDFITNLSHENGQWQLQGERNRYQSETVILANAAAAAKLVDHPLPLKQIRGQVSYCAATEASQAWQRAICHSGYLSPALGGLHCVGATFDLHEHDPAPRPEDNLRNLAELKNNLPDHWQALGAEQIKIEGERVGFRCQSRDFLPLAGPALAASGETLPGLYLNIAHGSRGISSTPLCAALIAALVNDEAPPIDQEMTDALAPARFMLRNTTRKRK